MSVDVRIQSAAGDWAVLHGSRGDGSFKGAPWLPGDLLAALALAAEDPKAPAELSRASFLLAAHMLSHGPKLRLPHTAESKAAVARRVELKAERVASRVHGENRGSRESQKKEIAQEIRLYRAVLEGELAPKKPQAWLYAPCAGALRWSADPGKASFADPQAARAFLERCALAHEVNALLPDAIRQARALGVEIHASLPAQMFKLPAIVAQLATASIVEFEPAAEYLSRECFAVYAKTARSKGFATHSAGELKPDLASARLFPIKAQAETHGARYFKDFALVAVDIAPLRFEPRGAASDLSDLTAAISAREAIEIDRAIEQAGVERLREELARRDASPQTPAPPGRARL